MAASTGSPRRNRLQTRAAYLDTLWGRTRDFVARALSWFALSGALIATVDMLTSIQPGEFSIPFMRRLLPTIHRVALHGVEASRRVERDALPSREPHDLMRKAGSAVARLALAIAPHARRVWIVAGPGNNGGDGLEAALHLQAAGRQVRVTLLGGRSDPPVDAADALARAVAAGVPLFRCENVGPFEPLPNDDWHADLVVDALLGIGGSRAPDGHLADLIERVNGAGCPVLSVDTPSGLDVDSGQKFGLHCVLAQHTLSLLTVKPGLFTGVGREQAGVVWFDSLQVEGPSRSTEPVDADAWLTGERDVIDALPERSQALHKGSFGDVAMIGGGPGMTGAALLSSRAAHASGAGKVFVDLLDPHGPTYDVVRPELMFRPGWHLGDAETIEKAVVVCGCGAGDAAAQALPRLLDLSHRLVLDADALNAVAGDAALQAQLTGRLARGLVTVMTPHPLEASRLAGCATKALEADRLGSAARLAERFQCVVVLKGSGTIVAAPGRIPHVNPTGNAALATGGT
ncbi:MAG: bifunctional ADP-dependent (S)-NAD(P)H-hydrate dehydratase/NAD(P)H-hydrate epimerase, partial [Rhizobacter sp.]|nr:bifunctional ADP-dependent (S)-NAD(P)H-hydrate dehydratase/NAD(P)H-hydrate epimerase [Rhizobacter sp.]